ncbi:MAG: signal recognition particle-docking protein FtsY [Candidatus Aenigmatarchaeota archaeon]
MFEILKDKLKKVVKSISEKIEKKEKVEEIKEEKSGGIFEKIVKVMKEKTLEEEDVELILDEFSMELIEADVAYEVVEKIKEDLKKSLIGRAVKKGEEKKFVLEALKKSLLEILCVPEIDLKKAVENKKPYIILFLGFNGSGKTSSIVKLGKYLKDSGYSCVFAASDTFRAASIEQLEEQAKPIGIKVVKQKYGADPAAVAFDAIAHAKANGIHFVLIDTAGRSHTNKNLMEQMKKIVRVAKPDLKVLVVDSLTGNDAVSQARFFNEIGIDAVIFTKVDVNEKGGSILSVLHELKKPVLFLSSGQGYENLEKFDPQKFVDNLLEI